MGTQIVLPSVSASPSAQYRLYALTKTELLGFWNEILGENFLNESAKGLISTLRYVTTDTSSLINSVMAFPLDVSAFIPNDASTGVTDNIKLGTNKVLESKGYIIGDGGLRLNTIPAGTITVPRHFNNFLDYEPYTTIKVWLPFCGWWSPPTRMLMGTTVAIIYTLDVSSGMGNVFVTTTTGDVIYTQPCQLGIVVPLSGIKLSDMLDSIRSSVTSLGGLLGSIAKTGAAVSEEGIGWGAMLGRMAQGALDVADQMPNNESQSASVSLGSTQAGYASWYNPDSAYAIVERPQTAIPSNYNSLVGRPSMRTSKLGSLSGFTSVAAIHLEGFNSVSAPELEEIERLLKSGVIL